MTFFFAISLAISRFTSLLYYAKLDGKVVCDNNKFCKTVKPNTCITLLENKVVESIERKVAEILKEYSGLVAGMKQDISYIV